MHLLELYFAVKASKKYICFLPQSIYCNPVWWQYGFLKDVMQIDIDRDIKCVEKFLQVCIHW